MTWRGLFCVCVLCAGAGCLPDLGEGDEALARTVVYQASLIGEPAYAGQALLHRSCGGGGSCHSEGSLPVDRKGAPFALNYDMALATNAESTEVLRRGQLTVYAKRRTIMRLVETESMPPGVEGEMVRDTGPAYRGLPEIDTPEGQDILRNWLAAGAPVVERLDGDRPMGTEPVGAVEAAMPDCMPDTPTLCGMVCVNLMFDRDNCGDCGIACADDEFCDAGSCNACAGQVNFAANVEPLLEEKRCNQPFCHSGVSPSAGMNLALGMAHASLVGVEAMTCAGRNRVSSGMASGSYILNKLRGVDLCGGSRMPLTSDGPLSPAEIQIIELWICGGAADD